MASVSAPGSTSNFLNQFGQNPIGTSSVPSLSRMALSRILSEFLQDPAEEPEQTRLAKMNEYPVVKNLVSGILDETQVREKLGAIRERFQEQIETIFRLAWYCPDLRNKIELRLLPYGSFARLWLSEMYQSGGSGFNWFVYDIRNVVDETERNHLYQSIKEWIDKVKEDFRNGHIHAFPQMVQWIRSRKISWYRSLALEEPFHQPEKFLPLLKKLSYLGVPGAQDVLMSAYDYNKIGDDEDALQLSFLSEQRLIGLKTLAAWGHAYSEYRLGRVYSYDQFSEINAPKLLLLEEERRKGMNELAEQEKKPNFYITNMFYENKIGNLVCNFSLDQRIDHLTKKAKFGDRNAFQCLWKLYTENKLEDELIPLELNEEQRWKSLEELRTLRNERLYRDFYIHWMYSYSSKYLPCKMTQQEKLHFLEAEFFECHNLNVIPRLVECYTRSRWERAQSSDIPLQERVEKLKKIAAYPEGHDAILALTELYLGQAIQSARRIDRTDAEEKKIRGQKNLLDEITFLAIRGRHWDFLSESIRPLLQDPVLQRILKLARAYVNWITYTNL